jgi:HSP20 family protein
MALPTRVSREQQQQQGSLVHPLELMHREFDDLISRFFGGGLFGPAAAGALPADAGMLAAFGGGYGVDVREDDRHIYVEADLPGFRKEDVDISIDEHTLTISAEHREEFAEPAQAQQPPQQGQPQQQAQQAQQPQQQQKQLQRQAQQPAAGQKGQYLLRERRYQSFTRSFTLPQNVDEQNVQAKLDNGVLQITLNKTQESKPKKVQVS